MIGFDTCYNARSTERLIFGANWCGPDRFEHAVETLAAQYPKDPGGDGQPADVFISAWPARFITIEARASANSCGDPKPAYRIQFGTGQERLAAEIAEAIATGMISFSTWEKE